jgi:hypothetical protein
MTRDQLENEIVRLLRALRIADESRAATLRRDLAEATVALREHFLTPAGHPDWSGSSGHYRTAMRELYSRADYSPEQRRITQSTVRYHIGNIVRERLSTSELEAAGLTAPSPHDRQRNRRARDRAIVEASAIATVGPHPSEADVIKTLTDCLNALRAIPAPTKARASQGQIALPIVEALAAEVDRVRRQTLRIIARGDGSA